MLVIKESDAAVLTSLMLGRMVLVRRQELNELHMSAVVRR